MSIHCLHHLLHAGHLVLLTQYNKECSLNVHTLLLFLLWSLKIFTWPVIEIHSLCPSCKSFTWAQSKVTDNNVPQNHSTSLYLVIPTTSPCMFTFLLTLTANEQQHKLSRKMPNTPVTWSQITTSHFPSYFLFRLLSQPTKHRGRSCREPNRMV